MVLAPWLLDQEVDDPNSTTPRPGDVPLMDDDIQGYGGVDEEEDGGGRVDQDDDDNNDEEVGVDDAQLVKYRKVIADSTAFQWLLCRI